MLPFVPQDEGERVVKMEPDSTSDEPSCSSQTALRSPKNEKKRRCSSSADVSQLVGKVWDDLLEETIFGLAMEHHRAAKMGFLDIDGVNCEVEPIEQFACSDTPHTDIFGQPLNARAVKQWECLCPQCNRNIAACRFAPHLEKCLGMGRSSTRVASRRAAATNLAESTGGASGDEESDQDEDWLASSKQRNRERARKKKSSANSGASGSKFHRATSGLAKKAPSASGGSRRKPLAKLVLPSSKQRRPESSFGAVASTSSRKFSSPISFATTSNAFAKFGFGGDDVDSDLFDDEIDSPRSLELGCDGTDQPPTLGAEEGQIIPPSPTCSVKIPKLSISTGQASASSAAPQAQNLFALLSPSAASSESSGSNDRPLIVRLADGKIVTTKTPIAKKTFPQPQQQTQHLNPG